MSPDGTAGPGFGARPRVAERPEPGPRLVAADGDQRPARPDAAARAAGARADRRPAGPDAGGRVPGARADQRPARPGPDGRAAGADGHQRPAGTDARVRVLLWHRAVGPAAELFETAYHQVSLALAGTPGLLGNELLRSPGEPDRLVVASEWESLAAFQAWERGPTHRSTTAPLRPYRDPDRRPPYEILQVVAQHRA